MDKKRYVSPQIKEMTQSYLDSIAPLLMSGGGNPAYPTYGYVCMFNNPNGLPILGHSAMLFESSVGRCSLYSFHPYDNHSAYANGSMAIIANASDVASFSAFRNACLSVDALLEKPGVLINNGHMQWPEHFQRYIKLKVRYQDSLNMQALASGRKHNPPEYSATPYNCQTFVNEVLAAGGVTLRNTSPAMVGSSVSLRNMIIPNDVFYLADASTTGVFEFSKINSFWLL